MTGKSRGKAGSDTPEESGDAGDTRRTRGTTRSELLGDSRDAGETGKTGKSGETNRAGGPKRSREPKERAPWEEPGEPDQEEKGTGVNDQGERNEAEEVREDAGYRPDRLSGFTGQQAVRESLAIAIASARARGEPLDHVLLSGPPGLGKTTLAQILAVEMGTKIYATSGPVLERPGDLAAILTSLSRGDLLFIDEIHRLSPVVEEILYPAMEDFSIDVMLGEGPSARSVRLTLEPFTLVGATTRTGLLGSPFRDRFGMIARLDLYPPADLAIIVCRGAGILGIPISEDGCMEIAKRSRGTPRIALRLLRRARDYALVRGSGEITAAIADQALHMLGIDEEGLDPVDRRILRLITEEFSGGPVGVRTIAIAVGEDPRTVEEVHEPFLIRAGYLKRTPQGRQATAAARKRLHRSFWDD